MEKLPQKKFLPKGNSTTNLLRLALPLNNSGEKSSMRDYSSSSQSSKKPSLDDYQISTALGRGSYAEVRLGFNLYTGKPYAIKIINKQFLSQLNKQHEVYVERYVLQKLNHTNIIKLHCTFQDSKKLYFVIDYCANRDLGTLIHLYGTLDDTLARFYGAEIFSALAYMHSIGIFHRDIKPENIGVTETMHLKILDFGTANLVDKYFNRKTMSFVDKNKYQNIDNSSDDSDEGEIQNLNKEFVGTAVYVSPEVLEKKYSEIGPMCDVWAFGVILYLFYEGRTPFKGKKESETFDNILNVRYSFTENTPDDAKDLISKILVKDPKKRIGYNSPEEIIKHPFFKYIDMNKLRLFSPPVNLNRLNQCSDIGKQMRLGVNDKKTKLNNSDGGIHYKNFKANKSINDSRVVYTTVKDDKVNLLTFNKLPPPPKKQNPSSTKKIDALTNKIVLEDTLLKKSPWFHYNTREVKLYSKGVLEYKIPGKKEPRASIPINEYCKVDVVDEFKFEFVTAKRRFIFKHKTKKVAQLWADKINEIIYKKLQKRH